VKLGGREDVFVRRQRAEHFESLEGARDTKPSPLVRRQPADVVTADDNPATRRLLQSGDHIERRGLARTVWTDHASDLTGSRGETHVANRIDPAESHRERADLEDRLLASSH
jgi:hypothetical protein